MPNSCQAIDMIYIKDFKPFVAIASCVWKHILQTSDLDPIEKLFFVLADVLACRHEQMHGERLVELSGKQWGKLLGRSETSTLKLQKQVEEATYFEVERKIASDNLHEINKIKPILPVEVFQFLNLSAVTRRVDSSILALPIAQPVEQRSYLDKTKLFVQINPSMLEQLLVNEQLTPLQKCLWLYCFMRSYCAYCDGEGEGELDFPITTLELSEAVACTRTAAGKGLQVLEEQGFISKTGFKTIGKEITTKRKRRSVWYIKALFPKEQMLQLKKQRDRASKAENVLPVDNYYPLAEVSRINVPKSRVKCDEMGVYCDETCDTIIETPISKTFKRNSDNSESSQDIQPPPSAGVCDVTAVLFETKIQEKPLDSVIAKAKCQEDASQLPSDKVNKAKSYARALRKRNLATGYAAQISEEQLGRELIHHAAHWVPTKTHCRSREEAIDFALRVAWKQIEQGTWACPHGLTKAEILDRELEATWDKYCYSGVVAHELPDLSREIDHYLQKELNVAHQLFPKKIPQNQLMQEVYHD